jgi:predicted TPR repeat methyltransferase
MNHASSSAPRVSAERFERKYEASPDPWDYRTSAYEREKYADTLAALPSRSYARALEVGCSIGVFTELLAPRCERLVAIDFSVRALELARERVGELANVEVAHASFPEEVPPGPWDLVVCSEVLYYLDEPTLRTAIGWLHAQLCNGASVLAVSWRGIGVEEPLRGDETHERLSAELGRWHAFDGRRSGYRVDRFDGDEP